MWVRKWWILLVSYFSIKALRLMMMMMMMMMMMRVTVTVIVMVMLANPQIPKASLGSVSIHPGHFNKLRPGVVVGMGL